MKRNPPPVEECGCCDCPPCPAPEFLCATSSASLQKCTELPEFGTPSSPPKFYLEEVESATKSRTFDFTTIVGLQDIPCCLTDVRTGSGGVSGSRTLTLVRPRVGISCASSITPQPPDGEYSEYRTLTYSASPDCPEPPGYNCSDNDSTEGPIVTPISWSQGLGYTETIISGTEKHLDKVEDDTIDEGPYPSGPCGCIFSSHREEAYEEHRVIMRLNEYLTALLRADALSLLAPLGALALCEGSAIIASYSLSPDEVTASVKKGDYGWRHPVPPRIPLRCDVDGGGPPCFRITWDRTFTPAVGAPVVTPMTYTWSGSTPEGYSETDKATWPKVSFSEEVPTDVGAVTISNVQYFCTGCE